MQEQDSSSAVADRRLIAPEDPTSPSPGVFQPSVSPRCFLKLRLSHKRKERGTYLLSSHAGSIAQADVTNLIKGLSGELIHDNRHDRRQTKKALSQVVARRNRQIRPGD